jgi:hypothetical protein
MSHIARNEGILVIKGPFMQLSAQETTLPDAFRRLPADAADELAALVQRLAALSLGTESTGRTLGPMRT